MNQTNKITIAKGDGIGPEIMNATIEILNASGAGLEYDEIEIGEKVYLNGVTSGIEPNAWDSLRDTRVFLKAPITTPQGGGYKSLNVTIRKALGLFANVRPSRSYFPFVNTNHPMTNMVIVRENEEDLYAGIEHQQTKEVVQCLKLVTQPGCEKIIRYAFEYARAYNRKKVTCMSKDNIMKHTDGLFHRLFDEIGKEYPDIEQKHMIIDIGSAMIADRPHQMDVVVTLNLYGDIISDIAAQITGSVGLGGSANIGDGFAMFEAIHGSAPDIAGKGIANPSGLINAAILMLVHLGKPEAAEKIENAWLKAIEDGYHTGDIFRAGESKQKVGTKGFAEEVIKRMGQMPQKLKAVKYSGGGNESKTGFDFKPRLAKNAKKELTGVDVFIDWEEDSRNPEVIGKRLEALDGDGLKLKMITNRGVKVYPEGLPETFCTDHWRCRFVAIDEKVSHQQIIGLLNRITSDGFDFIKTEHLYTFDGIRGYSLGQGE